MKFNINQNKWLLIGILIVIFISTQQHFGRFTNLQPHTHFLTQYAGRPETAHDNAFDWIDTHPLPLDFSETAILGDYKVVVQRSDRGTKYGDPYCAPNTCGGTLAGVDQYGCQLYNGISSEQQVCQKSCSGSLRCTADCSPYPSDGINCRSDCNCNYRLGDPCGPKINCFIGSGTASGTVTTYCQFATTCGGQTRNILYSGTQECWSRADVYYQDQLITTMDWDNRIHYLSLNKNQITNNSNERLRIALQTDDQYLAGNCYTIVSDYILSFEPEDFILNISAASMVKEGDSLLVYVNITNNYEPSVIDMELTFEVPTGVGIAQSINKTIVSIPTGISKFIYQIPTKNVPQEINVKSKLSVLMNGSRFSGINGVCYGQSTNKDTQLSRCQYVLVGTLEDPIKTVKIQSNTESLISSLQQNISFLQSSLFEKAQIINGLNLTTIQQATIIDGLELNASQMATVINNLNLDLENQEKLINALKLDLDSKIAIANQLNLPEEQKQKLISSIVSNSSNAGSNSNITALIIIGVIVIITYAFFEAGPNKGFFRGKKK